MLVVGIGASVAYTQLVKRGDAREIRWADVTAELGPVRWPKQLSVAFHSRRALVSWLAQTALPPKPAAPQIDFRRHTLLLAAVGPRSTTGYSVEVVRITERRGRIDVLLRERTPRLGERRSARLTFPYRLLTIHATTKPIHFSYEGRP